MTKVCYPLREHISGLPCLWHGRACKAQVREAHHEPYRSHLGSDVRGLVPLCYEAHNLRHKHPVEFLKRITLHEMAAAASIAWRSFCKARKLGPKAEDATEDGERWQVLEAAGLVTIEGKESGIRPLTKSVNKF